MAKGGAEVGRALRSYKHFSRLGWPRGEDFRTTLTEREAEKLALGNAFAERRNATGFNISDRQPDRCKNHRFFSQNFCAFHTVRFTLYCVLMSKDKKDNGTAPVSILRTTNMKRRAILLDFQRLEKVAGIKFPENLRTQLLSLVEARATMGKPLPRGYFYKLQKKGRDLAEEFYKNFRSIGLFRPSRWREEENFRVLLKEIIDRPFPRSKIGRPKSFNHEFIAAVDCIYEYAAALDDPSFASENEGERHKTLVNQKLLVYWDPIENKFKGRRLDFVCEVLKQAGKLGGAPYSKNGVAQFLKSFHRSLKLENSQGKPRKRKQPRLVLECPHP